MKELNRPRYQYVINVRLQDGRTLKRTRTAEDAASALGLLLDSEFGQCDPDHHWMTIERTAEVAPKSAPKKKATAKKKPARQPAMAKVRGLRAVPMPTDVEGEKRAAAAVKRLMANGVQTSLLDTGVLEAYGNAIAEGATR